MTRTKPARIVSIFTRLYLTSCLRSPGGQIGHRKYDCPEQRNFTANIICRVCGNAGHMARDCPDRQRGANWRNDAPGGLPGRAPAGRIGGGDAVDREYEVSLLTILFKTPTDIFFLATHARAFWGCTSRRSSTSTH